MSIREMQACLARLYVDDSFRKLFYVNPAGTLEEYGLTDDEQEAIRVIDPGMLDLFAGSLKNKRKKRFQRAYPMLFALAPAAPLARYYSRFYALYTAKPAQTVYEDIVDFGFFMEESASGAEDLPVYTSDLVRYERHFYCATSGPASAYDPRAPNRLDEVQPKPDIEARPRLSSGAELADFEYDMVEIEKAIQSGSSPKEGDIRVEKYTIVFNRSAEEHGTRMLRLNGPTKIVLDLCDGFRPISEIVSETQSSLRANDLDDRIIDTIQKLLTLKVLELKTGSPDLSFQQHRTYGGAETESL